MTTRARRLLACGCLLALAAAACRRDEDRAYSRGSTVVVAYHGGADVLKPDETSAELLVFLPLLVRNARGDLEGRLAHRWEHSPDYHEWTYHLRTDLRWHDGIPVTADDVKFSLGLFSHPDVNILPPGALESVTVQDQSTITIRSRYAARSYNLNVVYYPKHLLEHLDPRKLWKWSFWTRPVGNGPYRFVRYLPETMMELEANSDYYRGKPKIERVVLKFAKDAGLSELLSGNVDALPDANPAQLPKVMRDPRLRAYTWITGAAVWAIFWRADHPLFRDPRVRRALMLAINRRELRRAVNIPESAPLVDGPFLLQQLRRGTLPVPLPYDPEHARKLLEEAGWRDVDGDGVREREGRAFRFAALVISLPPVWEMAVYVQDQLRRVGVAMEMQKLDNATVRARLKSGAFEAAFSFLENGAPWLQRHFGGSFPTGYRNAHLVELIDRARITADPQVEDRLYRDIAEIFHADVPVTCLLPGIRTVLVHRRLRGLSSPGWSDPLQQMEDLWLEDRKAE